MPIINELLHLTHCHCCIWSRWKALLHGVCLSVSGWALGLLSAACYCRSLCRGCPSVFPPAASGFREPLDWCPLVALLWAGSILGVEEKERIPEKKKIWESLLYISAWEYLPDHRDRSGVMGVSCIAGRFFTIEPPGNPRRCNFLG